MHTQAIAVYLAITDFLFIAAVSWFVCKVNLKLLNLSIYETEDEIFPSFNHCCHRVTFVTINSKTSQVDKNPRFFMV